MLVAVACILSKPLAPCFDFWVSAVRFSTQGLALRLRGTARQPACLEYGKEVISRHGVLGGTLLLWNPVPATAAPLRTSFAANSVGDQAGKELAE